MEYTLIIIRIKTAGPATACAGHLSPYPLLFPVGSGKGPTFSANGNGSTIPLFLRM